MNKIINPKYETIDELLRNKSFSIDEFQREYTWERKHIEELLSDLVNKFQNSYNDGDNLEKVSGYNEYFLGSIIISTRNSINYLIDGQQRITSITLLLIYLYQKAKENDLPITETISPLIKSDQYGQIKFNLNIKERLPLIKALFEKSDINPSQNDESIQNMHARYNDIEDLIDLGANMTHFAYWLMKRVRLIVIATTDDSYAYEIFESMNDRGKQLSPLDMLKAYLVAPISDSESRKRANQNWKHHLYEYRTSNGIKEVELGGNFFKAWFRSQYAKTIRERKSASSDKDWELIGSIFHRWVKENQKILRLGSEEENIIMIESRMPFFAKAYRRILSAEAYLSKGLEPIYYNAHNDFTWQKTVLLASLDESDDDETVRRKLAITATYLDIWLMRRVVNYTRVGYSSSSYTMWLLCRDIRNKSLPDLVEILYERLASDVITFEGHLKRKEKKGIKALYLNQFSRRYIFHLLARITAFVEEESGGNLSFDKLVDRSVKNPFDIEHIWSNNLNSVSDIFSSSEELNRYRDNVASLLLLPADVNRSLKDKPYDYKLQKYASQNLYTASLDSSLYKHQPKFDQFRKSNALNFEAFTRYGKEEHEKRKQLLLSLANIVWSPERLKRYLND